MATYGGGAGRREHKTTAGAHRAPRRHQALVIRTVAVGGAFVCIGLASEMNLPDADALSILIPSGNGNATQINILEGNVFKPQLGLGGDGNNVSDNRTIGSIFFGGHDPIGVSRLFDGPIALGGATGTGNVTQINIASYNIFNPQINAQGGNSSHNVTISNVAAGNGNGTKTEATGSGTGMSLFGGAIGNGNAAQLSLFSSNIFNPQFSLFGDNVSDNTAVTNVAAGNGNGSTTSTTSTGMFGLGLFGSATGNGNNTQVASGSANVINPQFSLLGRNSSNNHSFTNLSILNGNFSRTSTSGGGILGTTLLGGMTGNGNNNQFASLVSNIVNPQWSIVGGNLSHNTADTNAVDTTANHSQNNVSSAGGNTTVTGTNGNGVNNQTGYGNGNIINDQLNLGNQAVAGLLGIGGAQNQQDEELLLTQQTQQAAGSQQTPRPLSTLVKRVKEAVDKTLAGVKPSTSTNPGAQQGDNPNPAGGDDDSTN